MFVIGQDVPTRVTFTWATRCMCAADTRRKCKPSPKNTLPTVSVRRPWRQSLRQLSGRHHTVCNPLLGAARHPLQPMLLQKWWCQLCKTDLSQSFTDHQRSAISSPISKPSCASRAVFTNPPTRSASTRGCPKRRCCARCARCAWPGRCSRRSCPRPAGDACRAQGTPRQARCTSRG